MRTVLLLAIADFLSLGMTGHADMVHIYSGTPKQAQYFYNSATTTRVPTYVIVDRTTNQMALVTYDRKPKKHECTRGDKNHEHDGGDIAANPRAHSRRLAGDGVLY